LTVKGGWPVATLKPSAVEPAFDVSLFVSSSALPPATGAESEVFEAAVFGWPRMKLPPLAGTPTPPSATKGRLKQSRSPEMAYALFLLPLKV
jgi:hypothetical protein